MTLPNFIIAGSQRSGSTYLHNLLVQHPDVFLPENKELQYFSDKYFKEKRIDLKKYSSFFSKYKGQKAIGETTPCYMFHDWVPRLLSEHLGNIKIIFLLRNPVERAYSHYWHEISKKREWMSFEDAVRTEEDRIKKDYWHKRNRSYSERGFYGKQIKGFLEVFPKENLLILFSEDLYKDPTSVLKEVCRFLNIQEGYNFSITVDKHQMSLPVFLSFFRFWVYIKYVPGRKNKILFRLASFIVSRIPMRGKRYPEMPLSVRKVLKKKYTQDVQFLQKLTEKKIPWQNLT